MDYETFIQSFLAIVKNSRSGTFLFLALSVCLLTQIIKKVFIPKLKIDLLHKFDPTILLPFILGLIEAVAMGFFVDNIDFKNFDNIYVLLIEGITIGATATAFYKLFANFIALTPKKMCKDDVFNAIYTQLLIFADYKQKLLKKEISLKEFLAQVDMVTKKAVDIYKSKTVTDDDKKAKLVSLMRGIIDDNAIKNVVDSLHLALIKGIEIEK